MGWLAKAFWIAGLPWRDEIIRRSARLRSPASNRPLPTITFADARAKAKRILAERTLSRYQTSLIGWQTAVEKFLDARRATGTKDRTVNEYRRTIKRYFGFGTTKVSEIGIRDIASKLEKLNHVPSQKAHALVT